MSVLGILIIAALIAVGESFLVQWIWNYVMPVAFGLKQLSTWQIFCLLVLARCFSGSTNIEGKKK